MAIVCNIRDVTEQNVVVYYPELGYMAFPADKPSFPGRSWIEHRIQYHLSRIKLLSLYFDRVFIPLSHIHIADDNVMFEITDRLFSHIDFRHLVESEVLFAGAWGGQTHEQIREHQVDFICDIHWPVIPSFSAESLATLNNMLIAIRDVRIQIRDLRQGILEYIELQKKPEQTIIPLQISEAAKFSEHKELPFVHEIFWQNLKSQDIPQEYRSEVICETNRIYFEAGETGNPGVILYHIPGSEPWLTPRISKVTGISCLVYHPDIFAAFISIFLKPKELRLLLERKPIQDFLILRDDSWRPFMRKYHELLHELELIMPYNIGDLFHDRQQMIDMIEKELMQEPTLDCSSVISFFIKLMDIFVKYACGGYDKTPVKEAGNMVKGALAVWLRNFVTKSKHKEFYEFTRMVKKSL